MADEKKPTVPASPKDTVLCDLRNPTRATRVIYDGIVVETTNGAAQKAITVHPGETKRGVTLHRTVVDELRQRNKTKADSDLIITAPQTEDIKAA